MHPFLKQTDFSGKGNSCVESRLRNHNTCLWIPRNQVSSLPGVDCVRSAGSLRWPPQLFKILVIGFMAFASQ